MSSQLCHCYDREYGSEGEAVLRNDAEQDDRGGVQTVKTVVDVLTAFVGAGATLMLKTVAERANMHPAKVHRYLVSLCKTGHVSQDPSSGRYRLGPATLRLGYAAMNAIPVVSIARPLLRELSELHRCSSFIALWSGAGPRIVLQEKEVAPIAVVAHVGSIFPLLTSATGRTFAAWLPREATEALLRKGLAALAKHPVQDTPSTLEEAQKLFADIRKRGLARATGQLHPVVHGLSIPVFDASDKICAVMTMLGQAGQFDTNWNGPIAASMREASASITATLKWGQ